MDGWTALQRWKSPFNLLRLSSGGLPLALFLRGWIWHSRQQGVKFSIGLFQGCLYFCNLSVEFCHLRYIVFSIFSRAHLVGVVETKKKINSYYKRFQILYLVDSLYAYVPEEEEPGLEPEEVKHEEENTMEKHMASHAIKVKWPKGHWSL